MMKKSSHILVVEAGTHRFWCKTDRGWVESPADSPPPKTFLVVSELDDEAVSCEALPALLPHDRNALAERRLAFAYPDTTMRAWAWIGKPLWGAGHAAFFALNSSKRIDEVVQPYLAKGCLVRGLRTSSALLWQLAKKLYGNQTCLVMMKLPHAIRLLAMSKGRPLLTRYLENLEESAVNTEIVATWRYLINQKLAAPGSDPVVHWQGVGNDNGIGLLFDTQSPLDLAPIQMRSGWLSQQLSSASVVAGVMALVLAFASGLTDILAALRAGPEMDRVNQQIYSTNSELALLERELLESGIPIEALKGAQRFIEDELKDQPYPLDDLQALSQVIARVAPHIRLSRLEWRRSVDEQVGCAPAAHSSNKPPNEIKKIPVRRVIDMTFMPDPALTPRVLDAALVRLSGGLKAMPGAAVEVNELDAQRVGAFTSGREGASTRQTGLKVCMVFGGVAREN